jgi:tetratricopeptide (TPR) repeat protein
VALLPLVLLGDLLRFRPAPPQPAAESEDEFFTPNRRPLKQRLISSIRRFSPLPGMGYAGLLAVLACYLALRERMLGSLTGGAAIPFLHNPLAAAEPAVRIRTAVKVLGDYLRLQFWPAFLSADYSYNQVKLAVAPTDPGFLAALACCLALLVGAILLWRTDKGRVPAFGILFFFCTIAPVSNIILPQDTIMSERLLYLPSLGFCLVLAWLLGLAIRGSGGTRPTGDNGRPSRQPRRWLVLALAVLVTLGYTARTLIRNRDWRDQHTLLLSAAAVSPDSARVHGELGVGYFNRGEYRLATRSLERALEILPDYPIALYMLGRSRIELGELESAREVLVRLAELRPAHPEILLALGAVDFRLGHLEEATDFFRQTLALAPRNRWALESLGIALSQRGLYEEAVQVLQSCLDLHPDSVNVQYQLASALGSADRLEEAETAFRAALEIEPQHRGSLLGLADICQQTGRGAEAAALRARARSDAP